MRQADLAKIGKFFGLQDIIVDHARLDDIAIIKPKDVDEARAFFDRRGAADALATLMMRYADTRIDHANLHITCKGSAGPETKKLLDAVKMAVEVMAGEREYAVGRVDSDYADMNEFVKSELARRKAEGYTPATSFPRRSGTPQQAAPSTARASEKKFGRPDPHDDKRGDGMW